MILLYKIETKDNHTHMKKILVILLLTCTLCSFIFANDYFISLKNRDVFPKIKGLSSVSDNTSSDPEKTVLDAFSQGFSFEWAETYLHPSTKKAIMNLHNDQLTTYLPLTDVYLSQPSLENKAYSLVLYSPINDLTISLVLDQETLTILSIGFEKQED